MNEALVQRLGTLYRRRRTLRDAIEKAGRRLRERLWGVDCRVFEKTIRFYREVHGQQFSPQEALQRALNKQAHKTGWSSRPRLTLEDKLHFYQEVHVYPFRQPYNKRFGGYRWCRELVRHRPRPVILEYGCGSAVWTEYLLERFPECQYVVADIPSVTLEFVQWKKRTYGYPYEILTIGQGKDGIPLNRDYDLIVCQDVLEHTPNPLEIAMAFVERLSTEGVLLVDFLNAPGGENLAESVEQRDAVKALLKTRLTPIKAIDDGGKVDGLYVKPAAK
jgi:SAM-dependent methyltransferase